MQWNMEKVNIIDWPDRLVHSKSEIRSEVLLTPALLRAPWAVSSLHGRADVATPWSQPIRAEPQWTSTNESGPFFDLQVLLTIWSPVRLQQISLLRAGLARVLGNISVRTTVSPGWVDSHCDGLTNLFYILLQLTLYLHLGMDFERND